MTTILWNINYQGKTMTDLHEDQKWMEEHEIIECAACQSNFERIDQYVHEDIDG